MHVSGCKLLWTDWDFESFSLEFEFGGVMNHTNWTTKNYFIGILFLIMQLIILRVTINMLSPRQHFFRIRWWHCQQDSGKRLLLQLLCITTSDGFLMVILFTHRFLTNWLFDYYSHVSTSYLCIISKMTRLDVAFVWTWRGLHDWFFGCWFLR